MYFGTTNSDIGNHTELGGDTKLGGMPGMTESDLGGIRNDSRTLENDTVINNNNQTD